MIRLTHPDLPTTAQHFPGQAPGAKINATTAPSVRPPLYRVNAYSQYGDRPGFEVQQEPMPDPLHVGRLFQVVFSAAGVDGGHKVLDVGSVVINGQTFAIARTPEQLTQPIPGMGWADQVRLNLYTSQYSTPTFAASAGDTVSAEISLQAISPLPDGNDNYSLDLGDFTGSNTFTITRVVADGLIFTAADNPSSPQTGEFNQDGTDLTLYGSATYNPRALRPLVLEGTLIKTLGDPLAVLATFDLRNSGIDYLDEVSYLSCTFRPIRDRYQPQTAEFFATRTLLTLVAPMAKAAWLRPVMSIAPYLSTLGQTSYQSTLTGAV